MNDTKNSSVAPRNAASERGGLGLAALGWLLGVPGIIILLLLILL